MKADLSRDTYLRQHHFARVLMQQGRVLLDADWNEQVSILLERTRMLAADLIGPHGGPGTGFQITCSDDLLCDFRIGWGRYYVDGIACELLPDLSCPPAEDVAPIQYTTQPDYPFAKGEEDPAELQTGQRYLIYLDVWERHLNALQADHIREVALGGPDTATRSKIICQVKAAPFDKDLDEGRDCDEILEALVGEDLRLPRCLRARARVEMPSDDPCLVPPTAQFRGPENQLYRVEIHDPGTIGGDKGQATFKWSRDNGSVVFGIRSLQGAIASLDSLGPDQARGLKEGDWVEILDDVSELIARPWPLLQIQAVDRVTADVTLAVPGGIALPVFDETATTHPILRRWDQPSDVIPVQESKWIDLEDGVQVWFEQGGDYKIGDFWQIPARTATADVLWPQETGPDGELAPKAMPPRGILHHMAPLRQIEVDGNGNVTCEDDCRCVFPTLCELAAGVVAPEPPEPPAPEPTEAVRPLGTVVFEAEARELSEESTAIARRNAAILSETANADRLINVAMRSVAIEPAPRGQVLAERRGRIIRELYVSNGVPADLISPASIVFVEEGEPQVETVMTFLKPARNDDRTDVVVSVPVGHVPGVGDVSTERLMAAGVSDAAALSRMSLDELVAVLSSPGGRSFPRNRAAEILREARIMVERG